MAQWPVQVCNHIDVNDSNHSKYCNNQSHDISMHKATKYTLILTTSYCCRYCTQSHLPVVTHSNLVMSTLLRCSHPHRCSCSGIGASLSFPGVPCAKDTPRDFILVVTWPCSCLCDFKSCKLKFVYYYYYYYYYYYWICLSCGTSLQQHLA